MSHHDYEMGLKISAKDYPFYALIHAAMRQADTDNLGKLKKAFPGVWFELETRYNAPGGRLDTDDIEELRVRIAKSPFGYQKISEQDTIKRGY